jgi:ketosteroid isomerase-like protein
MIAAILAAAVASLPNTPAVAEIVRLEHQWGQAFLTRDFAFVESIAAPEFKLVVASPNGDLTITPRAEWMRNGHAYKHLGFDERTVDVTTAGDTAVATVEGLWTVQMAEGQPARPIRFVVTDTWVRRHHRWQVIARYSHRLPDAPWPPAAK